MACGTDTFFGRKELAEFDEHADRLSVIQGIQHLGRGISSMMVCCSKDDDGGDIVSILDMKM